MALRYNSAIKEKSPLTKLIKFDIFNIPQRIIFQYSKYINGGPGSGKVEVRETNRIIDILSFYKELEHNINNLLPREELAIHSVVIKNNIRYHIPFIDFSYPTDEDIFNSMSKLQEEYNFTIYLFKSGRSYHAYFDGLLTDYHWKKFLGHLLLLNTTKSSVVDSRWVGHSIIQGFSSLRLSCNTPLYKGYPEYWTSIPKLQL